MKVKTTFAIEGKRFAIVQSGNGFMAIKEEDIDKDGKLLKAYDGITGNYSLTISECIARTKIDVIGDRLMKHGMTAQEATLYLLKQGMFD